MAGMIQNTLDYSASKAGAPASLKYASTGGENAYSNSYDIPQVDQGIVGAAMSPVPQVSATQTQGTVRNLTDAYKAGTQNASASSASARGYDAQTGASNPWDVADNQTVAGQIKGIVAEDSPLMQQAATRAAQEANRRGLVNSSMGVQAGQSAVYQAAMPIAQQDAQTYGTAARRNADATDAMTQANMQAVNRASEFTAGSRNEATNLNAQLGTDVSKFNAQSGNAAAANALQANAEAARTDAQLGLQSSLANQDAALKQSLTRYDAGIKAAMQDADAANKVALQQIDAATRMQITEVEAKYKTAMQASQSMSNTYSAMIDKITAVMVSKDLDAAGKQAAIDNLTTMYNNALSVQEVISKMDLGEILAPAAIGGSAGGTGGSLAAPAPAPTPAPAYFYDNLGGY